MYQSTSELSIRSVFWCQCCKQFQWDAGREKWRGNRKEKEENKRQGSSKGSDNLFFCSHEQVYIFLLNTNIYLCIDTFPLIIKSSEATEYVARLCPVFLINWHRFPEFKQ